MAFYRSGACGPAVAEIRAKLRRLGLLEETGLGGATGDAFDAAMDRAVRGFQQSRGLIADGVVGPDTYRALDEARWRLGDRVLRHVPARPPVGDDVAELQRRLLDLGFDPGRQDGILGHRTDAALREFQRNVGLPPDGTCGPRTLKSLTRLARTVVGGSPEGIREEERLRRGGTTPAGRVVVIDPGHGADDRGGVAGDLDEASIVEDLAGRLQGRLGAIGVSAYLTRSADACPDDLTRAAFANETAADLLVSLHVDAARSSRCSGVATYYYGHLDGRGSAVGRRLAGLVQREITARTDLRDCRSHPKTWDLLRLTRMPVARVEVGYLTNPGDAQRLRSSDVREATVEAVAAAIQRLYLPADDDASTGQLRIPALAG